MEFGILLISLFIGAPPLSPPPEQWLWPPASDIKRLPSCSQAEDALNLNLAFQRWCVAHAVLEPTRFEYYEILRLDAVWREECWTLLRSAHFRYTDDGPRWYLNSLRELIGDEAYYFGYLPHPLPIWAFTR